MWYRIYGWKENPFSNKAGVELVGVDAEKERIKDYVVAGDICFLTGERGVGKTSLLGWLRDSLRRHSFIYIDGEEYEEVDLDYLLKKNAGFWRKYPKNAVLLIDESQGVDEDLKKLLRIYWEKGLIRSVVISQIDDKLKNFSDDIKHRIGFRVIGLGKLNSSDSVRLIKDRCKANCPFDDVAINSIVEISDGNPRRILENCERVCIEVRKKGITKYDVEKVLLDEEDKDKIEFSPMQKKIIELLKKKDMNVKEIVELTRSTEGSIGKQMSNLIQRDLIKIVSDKRPKVYGLVGKE
ncbi:MAG: ATP-binding protein [Candidatus Woesearchaeota archaeon]